MEETVIRAVVTGVMLAIAGLIANLIWKAIRSVKASDEGSRRFRVVWMSAFALAYIGLMVSAPEIAGLMIALAVIAGAVYWVRSGMKK